MSRDPEQRDTSSFDAGILGYGELGFTEERIAFLAPRLKRLLADFRQLEALVRPEIEPAMTPDLDGYSHERE